MGFEVLTAVCMNRTNHEADHDWSILYLRCTVRYCVLNIVNYAARKEVTKTSFQSISSHIHVNKNTYFPLLRTETGSRRTEQI
jgi:hypothetical protein